MAKCGAWNVIQVQVKAQKVHLQANIALGSPCVASNFYLCAISELLL